MDKNYTCLFAHHHLHGEVSEHVFYYLKSLSALSFRIIFISDTSVEESLLQRLTLEIPNCTFAQRKVSHSGEELWEWAISKGLVPSDTDWLILTNSRLLGPLTDIGNILRDMDKPGIDFWALTDSIHGGWHLQADFMCFSKSVFTSAVFRKGLAKGLGDMSKEDPSAGEVFLTKTLSDAGFRGAAWISCKTLASEDALVSVPDPTLKYPDKLILESGFPFIPKRLLLENPENFSALQELFAYAGQHSSYPVEILKTTLTDVMQPGLAPIPASPSITVLCHMFYPSSIYYFMRRLAPLKTYNVRFIFNLSVALARDSFFLDILQRAFPNSILLTTPNKGRDIGGKLAAIDALLKLDLPSDYSLVIHDKLSPHAHTGIAWRETLFKVIDEFRLPEIFRLFEKNKDTGVISALEFVKNEYNPDNDSFDCTSRDNLLSYIKTYAFHLSNYNFSAGTIFWIRTGILKTFFRQFPPLTVREGLESGNALDFTHGTNIHAWERLFSLLANAQGFKVKGI